MHSFWLCGRDRYSTRDCPHSEEPFSRRDTLRDGFSRIRSFVKERREEWQRQPLTSGTPSLPHHPSPLPKFFRAPFVLLIPEKVLHQGSEEEKQSQRVYPNPKVKEKPFFLVGRERNEKCARRVPPHCSLEGGLLSFRGETVQQKRGVDMYDTRLLVQPQAWP